VEVNQPTSNVRVIKTKSPLNLEAWTYYLKNYPDKDKLLKYIKCGVPLGYTGPNKFDVHPNWPSAKKFETKVKEVIANDLVLGRSAGQFPVAPFVHFRGSPLGAFEKKRSRKIRLIQDLSWPPGNSVNDFIPSTSLHYITLDHALEYVRLYGRNTLMSKIDLMDAFKHIVIRPEDWHLCGSTLDTLNDEGIMVKEYYVNLVLPFGLSSSPQLFTLFADGLQYIMQQRGVTVCVNITWMTISRPVAQVQMSVATI
jgi:hypothetical protein